MITPKIPSPQRVRLFEDFGFCAKLKKKMLKAAENLEFEEAAKIRDEIKRLEKTALIFD